MSFRRILDQLLVTTAGAQAVIFLDYEGETVELVCDRDLSDHDLRIIGAYQGIFLSRLRELCGRASIGTPHRFKIDFDTRTSIMICDLKDGYYVVLLVDDKSNEGMAWRSLERCRESLMQEM